MPERVATEQVATLVKHLRSGHTDFDAWQESNAAADIIESLDADRDDWRQLAACNLARAEKAEAELAKSRAHADDVSRKWGEAQRLSESIYHSLARDDDETTRWVDWCNAEDKDKLCVDLIDSLYEWAERLGKQGREAKADRDRLAAIVERLPRTADGVRVIPMTDFVFRKDAPRVAMTVWANGNCADRSDSCGLGVWHVEDCYSTREAAEAAAKGVGDA